MSTRRWRSQANAQHGNMRHSYGYGLLGVALALALSLSMSAATHAQGGTGPTNVTITVLGPNGEPLPGISVRHQEVGKDPNSTGSTGQVTVNVAPDEIPVVTIDPNPQRGGPYHKVVVVLPPGGGSVNLTVRASDFVFGSNHIEEQIAAAVRACDAVAYDRWRAELDRTAEAVRREADALHSAAERFRADNGLPSGDSKTINKTVDRLFKGVGGAPIAAGPFRALFHLSFMLIQVDEKKADRDRIDDVRKHLPPRPEKCEKQSSAGVLGTQFYASAEGGPAYLHRPSSTYFRTEAGGVVLGFPALRLSNNSVAVHFNGTVGATFEAPFLGTGQRMLVELRGSHVSGNSDGRRDLFTPPAGATTGLFSPQTAFAPFGGYFTGSPLSDIRQTSRFNEVGGELRVGAIFASGQTNVTPFVGLRIARTTVEDHLALGIGAPAFTSFNQSSDVRATTYAPLIGARVRHELGGGFALVGEGSVALQLSRGSGAWSTFVPLVDPESRRAKLSGNKTGIGASGSVGLEYTTGGVTLGLAANVIHSGTSPHLAFADPGGTANGTGGARIGYGAQTTIGASARATFRF